MTNKNQSVIGALFGLAVGLVVLVLMTSLETEGQQVALLGLVAAALIVAIWRMMHDSRA